MPLIMGNNPMDLHKLAFWSINTLFMPGWNVSFCTFFLEGQLAMCIKRLKNIPTLWRGFPDGSVVKNRPAVQEPQKIQFRSLGWEDPLRREWLPTLVFLPGEFHGQNSWWTTVHKVAKSRTWLKQLSMHAPCDPVIPLPRNWLHTGMRF